VTVDVVVNQLQINRDSAYEILHESLVQLSSCVFGFETTGTAQAEMFGHL